MTIKLLKKWVARQSVPFQIAIINKEIINDKLTLAKHTC